MNSIWSNNLRCKALWIRKLEFVAKVQFLYINTSLGTQRWQVTKSYSRRLPALERFYREHSRGPPEFPNQHLCQIGSGASELWSDKQTFRHPNKDYKIIYIDILYYILWLMHDFIIEKWYNKSKLYSRNNLRWEKKSLTLVLRRIR